MGLVWSVLDMMWPVAERLLALHSGSQKRAVADSGGVVTDRKISNVKGKNLNMGVETGSDAGSGPSRTAGGDVGQADYSARGGGVICTDTLSNVDVDGDINLSVTAKHK